MSRTDELLEQLVDQGAGQVAHDKDAAKAAQKSDYLSALRSAENTRLDMQKSIREGREDRLESIFKFATNSIQGLAVSPIAANGLKYLAPIFGAVGLIYTGIKKGRLMANFEAADARAQSSWELNAKKLAGIGFKPNGDPLDTVNTSAQSNTASPSTGGPGILGMS